MLYGRRGRGWAGWRGGNLHDGMRALQLDSVEYEYRSSPVAEHTSDSENSHHETHENWTVEPVFNGGAAALSAIEIPTGTEA